MLAWKPNLRSKNVIRSADTQYYVDPSIATAALGIGDYAYCRHDGVYVVPIGCLKD